MSMISGQVKFAFFIRRWIHGGPVLQKRKKSQSASWTWTRNCIIQTLPLSVCVCLPRVWGTLCVFLFYDRRWDGWGSPPWLTRPVGSIDDAIVHFDVMLMRLLVSNTRWPWFKHLGSFFWPLLDSNKFQFWYKTLPGLLPPHTYVRSFNLNQPLPSISPSPDSLIGTFCVGPPRHVSSGLQPIWMPIK
jgi:hypothetical protein